MPNIVFEYHDDNSGRIKAIYRDGEPLTKPIRVETPNSIVQTYFKSAFRDLRAMTDNPDDRENNRHHGLQSFLMSLVGLEAFLNVFFHLVGRQKGLSSVVDTITNGETSVDHKIHHLTYACFQTNIANMKFINKKVRELYRLRSDIVHPKWEPVTLAMTGVVLDGMSDNFQQAFEDREFVREALRWCLLVVARIGLVNSPENANGFIKFWTTLSDTNESLSRDLNIE